MYLYIFIYIYFNFSTALNMQNLLLEQYFAIVLCPTLKQAWQKLNFVFVKGISIYCQLLKVTFWALRNLLGNFQSCSKEKEDRGLMKFKQFKEIRLRESNLAKNYDFMCTKSYYISILNGNSSIFWKFLCPHLLTISCFLHFNRKIK